MKNICKHVDQDKSRLFINKIIHMNFINQIFLKNQIYNYSKKKINNESSFNLKKNLPNLNFKHRFYLKEYEKINTFYFLGNCKTRKIFNFSSKSFSKNVHVDKDGFPIPEKRDIYDEDDMIINIGEKEKFKGMLIICPTPLGNINDISIRQFEAMKNGDILACEDSRKTGKLLEFIQIKKMKEKFFAEFGISFEEFLNIGGLNMTDEQIQSKVFKKDKNSDKDNNNETKDDDFVYYNEEKKNEKIEEKEKFNYYTSNDVNNESHTKIIEECTLYGKFSESTLDDFFKNNINFDDFYSSKDDFKKNRIISTKFSNDYNQDQDNTKYDTNKNLKRAQEILKNNNDKEVVNEIFEKISNNKDKINSLDNIFSSIDLNLKGKSTLNKEDILSSIKIDEPIEKEYYTYVKDSSDFKKRKIVLDNSDDILKKTIDPLAEKYDKENKLSYKLRNKARFLMGMSKRYEKKKSDSLDKEDMDDEDRREYELNLEEEITLNSGINDDMIGIFKQKIKEEKEKKGRGLLIPFNQENEEKKIPKLIKAMKLGLRVVLLSDSGTPTISDPGYKLVKEAAKNGIVIEPLPGPSAVITGLSASALPTDKFMFYGYLPKNGNEKIEKLEEIKQIGVTSVIFESPMRLQSSLNILSEIYGENHEIYIGFELTKRFENHLHGSIKNVKRELIKLFMEKNKTLKMSYIDEETVFKEDDINIKGEITMVIGPIKKSRDEYLEEKNLRENLNIDILEFTKRLNKHINLKEDEMRDILIKVCDIPKVKANKILNIVKNRTPKIKQIFEMMSNKNMENMKIPDPKRSKSGMLEEKEKKNPTIKYMNSISYK